MLRTANTVSCFLVPSVTNNYNTSDQTTGLFKAQTETQVLSDFNYFVTSWAGACCSFQAVWAKADKDCLSSRFFFKLVIVTHLSFLKWSDSSVLVLILGILEKYLITPCDSGCYQAHWQ